jgi:methionyl-tRNA formyltransferase
MKVLFLGSKSIGYDCLLYMIQQQEALQYEIVGVLSNDNNKTNAQKSISLLAQQYQLPFISTLDEMPSADILMSVQYHTILNEKEISKAKRAFNLHMAPLPEYRGCNQFSFAIIEGKKEFGTTLHVLDAKIDHGDIVAENRFAIDEKIWVDELFAITEEKSLELFKNNWQNIVQENYSTITQQSLITERGTSLHYRKEIQTLKQIDLAWDQEKIERHIRATYMPGFEPPYTIVNNQKIYFTLEKHG